MGRSLLKQAQVLEIAGFQPASSLQPPTSGRWNFCCCPSTRHR